MAFTLTLLGNDITFSPGHLKNDDDRVEILSYVSTLITGAPIQTNEIAPFRNTHVAVINGPSSQALEIGDRISRGIQTILEAISRGETDISIIASSSGGIIALLVAHEVERIQTLLKSPEADLTRVTMSPCKYTQTAMNGPHFDAFEALNLNKIRDNIADAKLSIFSIDPIPGGTFSISQSSVMTWRDPRFYIVPQIVKDYEQYIYENERRPYLKAIVPKCASSETIYKLRSVPGCHGTGTGFIKNQQSKYNGKTTKHAQELILVKMIDFLHRNNVVLARIKPEKDPFSYLMSPLFKSPLLTQNITSLYLELYNNVNVNKEIYQHINTSDFHAIGQQKAIINQLWKNVKHRIVRYHAHNDTSWELIAPVNSIASFLNFEHANIYLLNTLGLKQETTLSKTINQSLSELIKFCGYTNKLDELNDSYEPDSKEAFTLLVDGLGMLIKEAIGICLQNNLSDEKEQEQLYSAIEKIFTYFKRYSINDPSNELAKTILNHLIISLKTALENKLHKVEEQYKLLLLKMENKVFFHVLQDKIQLITTHFTALNIGKDLSDVQLMEQLNVLLTGIATLSSFNPKTDKIRTFIEEERLHINAIKIKNELAKDTKLWINLLINEAIDDSYSFDPPNIIGQFIETYNQFSTFKEITPYFKAFNDAFDHDSLQLELKEKQVHMIHVLGQYIVKEGLNLEIDVQPLFIKSKELYKQIEGIAFGFGVENLLTTELNASKKIIQNLNNKITTLEERSNQLHKENASLIEQLNSIQLEQDLKMVQLSHENVALENQLNAMKLKFQHDFEQFNQTKQGLNEQLITSRLNHQNEVQQLIEEKQNLNQQLINTEQEYQHTLTQLKKITPAKTPPES